MFTSNIKELKRYCLRLLLLLAPALLVTVIAAYLIDPYNVFHPLHMRNNGVEPNKNYIKMTYVLSVPEKFDAFLFGSSRVGSIHVEKIPDVHCYNMTYSMGLPKEHLDNLKTFISHGLDVKRVYIGLDNISYLSDYRNHYRESIRMPYEYLKRHPWRFFETYFDLAEVVASLDVIKEKGLTEGDNEAFYEYGWWGKYGTTRRFDGKAHYKSFPDSYLADVLSALEETAALCEEHDIELVLFTNPLYYQEYESVLNDHYLELLEGVAAIHPFYNFAGYNDITTDPLNYRDESHYIAETGDLLLDAMLGEKPDDALYERGFGWLVDEDNIADLLAVLAEGREKYRLEHDE